MTTNIFSTLYQQIINDPMNSDMLSKGYEPIYTADKQARIAIIGQAPGIKAQKSKKPWNDLSGKKLREWLGVTDTQFYNPNLIALVPMDFYYPGRATHGDLPPRKDFAKKWHPLLFKHMPNIQLTILVGAYSQKYYLGKKIKKNLTKTVYAYNTYLPEYFPIIHPSPLNLRWQAKNPWFIANVVPPLQNIVKKILLSYS